MEKPNILSIAGSDSGGGAGIQADLKTVAGLGGYCLNVITALTAQNGKGVFGIHDPGPEFVLKQLDAVLDGFEVSAAKTGMLFSGPTIEGLAARLEGEDFPLVVDPVCVSQSGHRLLLDEAVEALKRRMLPLADLVTPNRPEAELLAGMEISGPEARVEAMQRILDLGPRAVLLKGGHFLDRDLGVERVVDWLLVSGGEVVELSRPRVETRNTHGTGCTLSAAVACMLGRGLELAEAVGRAQEYLNLGLRSAYAPGQGDGPPNHMAWISRKAARVDVLEELGAALERLESAPGMSRLVPEVRMNLALSVPWPDFEGGLDQVAAIGGRITADRRGRVRGCGCPEFGASSHMAKVVLAACRVDPGLLCAVNIRYNDGILAAMDRAGLTKLWFDRADEPREVKEREGSTLEWGTFKALSEAGRAADAVCDPGESGKEPMIRVLGRDTADVLDKLERIITELDRG